MSDDVWARTLGERLAKIRRVRDRTQQATGRMLGVSRKSVMRWEADLRRPADSILERYAAVFDVPLDWIIHDDRR